MDPLEKFIESMSGKSFEADLAKNPSYIIDHEIKNVRNIALHGVKIFDPISQCILRSKVAT